MLIPRFWQWLKQKSRCNAHINHVIFLQAAIRYQLFLINRCITHCDDFDGKIGLSKEALWCKSRTKVKMVPFYSRLSLYATFHHLLNYSSLTALITNTQRLISSLSPSLVTYLWSSGTWHIKHSNPGHLSSHGLSLRYMS